MPEQVIEPCPKCGGPAIKGESRQWDLPGKIFYTPADHVCGCGIICRWIVPLFKTNESGWRLQIKKDTEPALLDETWEEVTDLEQLQPGDEVILNDSNLAVVIEVDAPFAFITNSNVVLWTVKNSVKKRTKKTEEGLA